MYYFKTPYQEILQPNGNDDILIFKWLPTTEEIDEDTFMDEIRLAGEHIDKLKPQKVLLQAKDLNFVITIPIQEKINEILLPIYQRSGVKKLAVILPEEMLSNLAVQITIEAKMVIHSFETRYFSNEEAAMEWLNRD